jgi:hypothetical protein
MMYSAFNKRLYVFLFICFFGVNQGFGAGKETPEQMIEMYKAKYPKRDFICLNYEKHFTIKQAKDSLIIAVDAVEEFLYLTKKTSVYGERSIGSSSFLRLKSLSAHAENDVDGKYKKFPVKNFKESNLGVNDSFFDDVTETSFRFDNISAGSKSYMKIKHELTDKHFLPLVRIAPHLTYENFLFTVTAPASVNLQIDTFNFEGVNLTYTIENKGKNTIHTWQVKEFEAFKQEDGSPDSDYYGPIISVRIATIENKGQITRVLQNLDDLHNWYSKFAEAGIDLENKELKALSDSIVGNETDLLNKAKLIYRWVQQNIRYIAIEDGYNGFIPAAAAQVCSDRFGDCKGMSNVLYHLLVHQGIDAHLTWVGTRDRPFKYDELPGPAVDNHMITHVNINGIDYFLDATHNNLPFNLPSPFTQGKECLVYYSPTEYKVMTIPEVTPKQNLIIDSVNINIEGRDLIGNGIAELHGYRKMYFIDRQREKTYDYLKSYSRGYLKKGSNKFVVDTVWFSQTQNPNEPMFVHYSFRIPDYLIQNGNEFYLNPNLDKIDAPSKLQGERKLPYEFKFNYQIDYIFNFELPNNLQVNYLPEGDEIDAGIMSFTRKIELNNQNLHLQNTLIHNTLMVEPSEVATYNNFLGNLLKSFNNSMELKLIDEPEITVKP